MLYIKSYKIVKVFDNSKIILNSSYNTFAAEWDCQYEITFDIAIVLLLWHQIVGQKYCSGITMASNVTIVQYDNKSTMMWNPMVTWWPYLGANLLFNVLRIDNWIYLVSERYNTGE